MLSDSIATSPFAGRMVLGAMEAARARGHQILLMESRSDPGAEAEAIAELRARRVDGFVYAAMELTMTDVPAGLDPGRTVLANCLPLAENTYAAVMTDERGGGPSAVDVLLAAGHEDVALVGGPEGNIAADNRTRGFTDGLRAAGLSARQGWVRRIGWQIDEGYAAALNLLDATERPTAVVCANGRVATGVLLAAARLGIA
ncbi:DNA-binding LacI/PurR family transcriptional regulator [Streptomyces sp. DSM 40167]|nr:substrate-binding domain-containing protein [Streptomyces sp. DSM 40167]MDQ0406818.1 DNA-binding LacI/PurR family transcriptional regulator [Streptomyces sp. DSM 40167]